VHLISGMQCVLGFNEVPNVSCLRWHLSLEDGANADVHPVLFEYAQCSVTCACLGTESTEVTRCMVEGIIDLASFGVTYTPQRASISVPATTPRPTEPFAESYITRGSRTRSQTGQEPRPRAQFQGNDYDDLRPHPWKSLSPCGRGNR